MTPATSSPWGVRSSALDQIGSGLRAPLLEKYGETLYREAGFTETAEKINGRLAQVGFVLAVQNTFNGDVLTSSPYPSSSRSSRLHRGASLVPAANPQDFPEGLKGTVMRRTRAPTSTMSRRRRSSTDAPPCSAWASSPHRPILGCLYDTSACVTRRIDEGRRIREGSARS